MKRYCGDLLCHINTNKKRRIGLPRTALTGAEQYPQNIWSPFDTWKQETRTPQDRQKNSEVEAARQTSDKRDTTRIPE